MLLQIDKQDGELVSGTHIQWCCACDLLEAARRARLTEAANHNHITVAVIDDLYDSYTLGRHYANRKRLDTKENLT